MILDLPPPLWVPAKPAIIRPALDLAPPKLAMPLTLGMLKRRSFNTITFVGQTTALASSFTMPAHAAGDLIIGYASSVASTVATLPAGWTLITTGVLSTMGVVMGYKIAASSSETSGTWSGGSTTTTGCVIYRGATGVGTPSKTGANSTTMTWPSLTIINSGSSWLIGYAAMNITKTGTPNAPTGKTIRSNDNYNRVWDTNGVQTGDYSSQTATIAAQAYQSMTMELFA